MATQFPGQPRAMDFSLDGVMQDVQAQRGPLKFPHGQPLSGQPVPDQ
ncbi:hypothetical protein I546_6349 [Mycobacterium kansasii 732]|nr:hypothetical protein I546_6349 [Mycobacterium kansasii 732]